MFIIFKHIIENYGVFSWWINYGIIWFYLGIIGIILYATRNNPSKKPDNPAPDWKVLATVVYLLAVAAMYHLCCCCCP
jgi:hypothetical protein